MGALALLVFARRSANPWWYLLPGYLVLAWVYDLLQGDDYLRRPSLLFFLDASFMVLFMGLLVAVLLLLGFLALVFIGIYGPFPTSLVRP